MVHKPGEVMDVHRDFFNPYEHDDFLGTAVPLYHHRGTTRDSGLTDPTDLGHEITDHR